MLRYQLINSQNPHYSLALALRHRLLRAPLGLEFTEEELAADGDALHAIALQENAVVGCATALIQYKTIKIRQMAVEPDLQSRGIGRALMQMLEQHFIAQGRTNFQLSARASAIGFYERCGYQIEGEPFEQVGLPHRLMVKRV